MKMKSHRRLYLAESDMSLSKLFLISEKERERDTRHGLRLCDDSGVWGLEIREMEGEGWDRRWRVRVRVEIGDGGLEGEGWDRRWRVRVRLEMEGEGEGEGFKSERLRRLGGWGGSRSGSWEADVWERLARVKMFDQILYIQSLKPCF